LILGYTAASKVSNRNVQARILQSTWCVNGLILGIFYSSILISFIMTPNPQPLVSSVQELAEKKDVGLIVFKNFAPELQILVMLSDLVLLGFIFVQNILQ